MLGGSQNTAESSAPGGTSEDWVVLDSGKSFAWSAQQQGSHWEQLDALRKLVEQQQQQVDTVNCIRDHGEQSLPTLVS